MSNLISITHYCSANAIHGMTNSALLPKYKQFNFWKSWGNFYTNFGNKIITIDVKNTAKKMQVTELRGKS